MIDESAIGLRFAALSPVLDERGRRRFAAAEALTAGRGGISAVSRATGLARSTIGRALGELRAGEELEAERVRRPGGGRKPLSETDASLIDDLRCLVEPTTRGDPQSPLLWTCKSLRKLSHGLREMGHKIGRAPWWASCSTSLITVCNPIARRERARTILIAMRNSTTSTIG